jgi:hypothetical protein
VNFAEQLAYWYLRLNGFLPLTNFVLHHEHNYHRTSDADIIAVRFPHVFEPTGGQQDDWDDQFDHWGLWLTAETIGLIVEVKSGEWRRDELRDHLEARHWRVSYAIRRLGMFTEQEARSVASTLCDQSIARQGGVAVAKLLVGTTDHSAQSWLHLRLEAAAGFIRQRMKKYANRKESDRLFFDGDLIQFLAWRGGRNL